MQIRDLQFERRSVERFLVALAVETDRGPGITRDVSLSGLCLITGAPLIVGDRVELAVSIPDRDRALSIRVCANGTVVRVEEGPDEVTRAGIALDEGDLSMSHVIQH